MNIIKGLLDRVIFTIGVLLFMQAPHFVELYEQRLGGYYQAQVNYLQEYQDIADQQHNGSLDALINDFNSSAKASVQQTGNNIQQAIKQSELLKQDVHVLKNESFVAQLIHLATALRTNIAQATAQSFKPAFQLSLESLLCGLLGGIFMSLIFNILFSFPKMFSAKRKPSKQTARSNVKQRVEPTIMRSARTA